jgi:hypothetical protein
MQLCHRHACGCGQAKACISWYDFWIAQRLKRVLISACASPTQYVRCRPYATDFSPEWLLSNALALVAGAMITNQLADYITELKLGNGTSILIFANIASFLPSSIGQVFAQAAQSDSSGIAVYMVAFLATTFAIVCVQVWRSYPCHGCTVWGASLLLGVRASKIVLPNQGLFGEPAPS